MVDYTTGKVLVDLVEVNDWGDAPNLRPRMYHDMLYTSDGTSIEHMPVSMRRTGRGTWPTRIRSSRARSAGSPSRSGRSASPCVREAAAAWTPSGGMGGYDDMYNMGGGGAYNR